MCCRNQRLENSLPSLDSSFLSLFLSLSFFLSDALGTTRLSRRLYNLVGRIVMWYYNRPVERFDKADKFTLEQQESPGQGAPRFSSCDLLPPPNSQTSWPASVVHFFIGRPISPRNKRANSSISLGKRDVSPLLTTRAHFPALRD